MKNPELTNLARRVVVADVYVILQHIDSCSAMRLTLNDKLKNNIRPKIGIVLRSLFEFLAIIYCTNENKQLANHCTLNKS